MPKILLVNSTGYDGINNILAGIVGIFETVFSNRIRAYHVTGSYSNGTAISGSDIDMTVVFKGDSIDEQEEEKFYEVSSYCESICSVELGFECVDEGKLLRVNTEFPYTHYAIINKIGSLLVYGEDIRDNILLPPVDTVVWTYMEAIFREYQCFLAQRHQPSEVLTFPLRYPEPKGEFYGYVNARGIFDLVLNTGLAVTILCAVKAQRYVPSKSDCPRIYAECINDEWTTFVYEVFEKCRYQWEQRVPKDEEGRRQLREICRRMLAYENHFLSVFRKYLLARLRDADRNNQILAAQWLGRIIYSDEEVQSALRSLENTDNKEFHQVVV